MSDLMQNELHWRVIDKPGRKFRYWVEFERHYSNVESEEVVEKVRYGDLVSQELFKQSPYTSGFKSLDKAKRVAQERAARLADILSVPTIVASGKVAFESEEKVPGPFSAKQSWED